MLFVNKTEKHPELGTCTSWLQENSVRSLSNLQESYHYWRTVLSKPVDFILLVFVLACFLL
jgi:hypothetical protein